MSDTAKRKKPNMIHIGIGILTVLLVVFIVILMQLVSNIQGTAPRCKLCRVNKGRNTKDH